MASLSPPLRRCDRGLSLLKTCSEYWGEGGRGATRLSILLGCAMNFLNPSDYLQRSYNTSKKGAGLPLIHHKLVYVDSSKVAFHSVLYTFPKVRQGEFL